MKSDLLMGSPRFLYFMEEGLFPVTVNRFFVAILLGKNVKSGVMFETLSYLRVWLNWGVA